MLSLILGLEWQLRWHVICWPKVTLWSNREHYELFTSLYYNTFQTSPTNPCLYTWDFQCEYSLHVWPPFITPPQALRTLPWPRLPQAGQPITKVDRYKSLTPWELRNRDMNVSNMLEITSFLLTWHKKLPSTVLRVTDSFAPYDPHIRKIW